MNSIGIFNKIGMRTKLSTLWIFVTLNYLYCDLFGLMDPVILNQLIDGDLGFVKITENFLLSASILMEIPIAMVLLSRILNYKANRWANIIAGSIKTFVMVASMFVGEGPTLYYLFFGIIEIAATTYIVWISWNWKINEE